ncbi:CRISPR-associated protein Cas4 [Candidatus Bipolaricaulota bacterium]|nr:CRISPR-associated protein Cas4 [Candidatus Bipolaricaulota bacterium]
MKDPLPVGLVAEYVFCPRSAWLSYSAGAFQPNEFTVEGEILHRRVHSRGSESRGHRRTWRRVALYSYRLGLAGYADMVEEIDGQFFPVEHKRGRLRRSLSDQVQLCAQGLCLEEMLRQPVELGYIYYSGSRGRLEVDLTGPLRRLTMKSIHELRELLRSPQPPQAAASAKCRGCAQAAACMPEHASKTYRFDWKEWLE